MELDIREIPSADRKQYMDLLLIGDEQPEMIAKYLDKGWMFALFVGGKIVSSSIVIQLYEKAFEIKNIATYPDEQNKGYGTTLLKYIIEYFVTAADVIYVGTGNNRKTLDFYKHCGFEYSHTVKNFFIDNYDHPIIEEGKQLIDMIYLKKVRKS